MKVELNRDSTIEIIAETITEAFALQHLTGIGKEICNCCGQIKVPIIINCSILMGSTKVIDNTNDTGDWNSHDVS